MKIQLSIFSLLLSFFIYTGNFNYISGGRSSSPVSGDKSKDVWGDSDYWVVELEEKKPLSGTYTLGGANSDYTTFGEAVYALQTYGISAPVTFKVQPGVYKEQITINYINGASCENNITFMGTGKFPASSVIQGGLSPAITINNVDGIIFRNLGITAKKDVIKVFPNSDCFILENNEITGTGTGNLIEATSSNTERNHYHEYIKNKFINGNYGILKKNESTWNSNSTKFDDGIIIEGNEFLNNANDIKISGQKSFSVSHNNIYKTKFNKEAIYIADSWFGKKINNNTIEIEMDIYGDTAIIINNSAASEILRNKIEIHGGGKALFVDAGIALNDEMLVANNLFHVYSQRYHEAISIPASLLSGVTIINSLINQFKFYNNTMLLLGSTIAYNIASTFVGKNNSFDIKNNIFYAPYGRSPYGASATTFLLKVNPTSIAEMDYNNLYGGLYFAKTENYLPDQEDRIFSLSSWQELTGFDQHSIIENAYTDRVNSRFKGAGTYLAEIQKDFYGINRNNPPTIGAVEEEYIVESPKSNTYIIGGENGDFGSFSEAISFLRSVNIEDSIIFKVNPGVYPEQVFIVEAYEPDGKIIFEGENRDSTTVQLIHPSLPSVYIEDIYGISFRHITIGGIEIVNSTASFENNIIKNGVKIYSKGGFGGFGRLLFENNRFLEKGIYVDGTEVWDYIPGPVMIYNNSFEVRHNDAIFITGTSGEIFNNKILVHNGGKAISGTGIFKRNKIILPDGGIAINSLGSEILNNMISVKSKKGSSGINLKGRSYLYFNSIYLYGENKLGSVVVFESEIENIVMKNNILANFAGGILFSNFIYEKKSFYWTFSDHNNLFTAGKVMAAWKEDSAYNLEDWQRITGFDKHSLSVDPEFKAVESLIPSNEKLDNAGTSIDEIQEDFFGNTREDPPTIGAVEIGLQSPVADAGDDRTITLPKDYIVLYGIAKNPNGRFKSFRWEKVTGPEITLKQANTANAIVTGLVKGVYVFRFSATDVTGVTVSDELTITVNESNQPPVVSAGPDRTVTLPVDYIVLSGTGKDPDGRFTAFLWEKVSGPPATLHQEKTANLVVSGLAKGTYVFRFSATDNEGAISSDEITVTVKEYNQPPTVSAGPDRSVIIPRSYLILNGIAKDADGRFIAFKWEKLKGPSVTMVDANTANLVLDNLEEGEYRFRFSATDNDGATASDIMNLIVRQQNQGPSANAGGDRTVYLPIDRLILHGTASDPDGIIVNYQWEKHGGPSVTMHDANTANLQLHNLKEGKYIFSFTATDDRGAARSDNMTLTVKAGPTARIRQDINVTAYPNTFENYVHVTIETTVSASYQIMVYDMNGRTYYKGDFDPEPKHTLRHQIDLSDNNIKEGVYLIRVVNRDSSYQKILKVIKD